MAKRKATVQRRQDGHHGARVAICRELVPGDFSSAVPVEGFRKCGGFDLQELDDFCMWWTDQYAQAFPGETFAYESPVNGRVTRSRMPADFPTIALPESSAEYEAECARRFALWGEPSDPEIRRLYAGYDELQRQIDEALGKDRMQTLDRLCAPLYYLSQIERTATETQEPVRCPQRR